MTLTRTFIAATLVASSLLAQAQPTPPVGEIKGTAWSHTAESLLGVVQQADVVLPAKATGAGVFAGKFKDIPKLAGQKVPVVLFLHGSSGLGLKAIGEWQQWLATQGFASMAPNSFALPGHVTYSSPIDKESYERIHALRASEIAPALEALRGQGWADANLIILAGTSEGSVPVARYPGKEFAARMVFSWSCEPNYFVKEPLSAFEMGKPVLNVISATDPFFSKSNSWLGNPAAQGHCAAALKSNPQAAVLLIPDAPHTLLNLPAARAGTAGFLAQFAKP
ncbi:MAG: alpha/beta hydrolase [Burkholderiaceae bacterium]|nr:alpha/beta hydrolase [Burkholderiaceae bacterium]